MEPNVIHLRDYQHGALPDGFRQLLIDVHSDAYSAELAAGDEFTQRFPWFVDHWTSLAGFSCVVAFDGDEPVGFAYGAPLADGREWWREHITPAPDPSSTFGFSELMVRPKWRKAGVSAQLQSALIDDRPEALSVLLVDPEHPKVQKLYESWGYKEVGFRQPFADSPRYAVLVRTLH
ncbi:GNAT family N-acetyltransferase [Kitasatospora indigofera]|uniref:GNAT family N-acetyltransferase n=1 Tax=Kitasatospora indigofera TaxID=67307 RepID=UPI0033AEC01A